MDDLFYQPLDLALILNTLSLSTKQEMNLLEDVWHKEHAFIPTNYRDQKKQYFLDVMYWKHHLRDEEVFAKELPGVYETMKSIGIGEGFYETLAQYQGIELFFKQLRVELSCLNKPYIRYKCRTLLHQYGYERRSQQLINYITLCLYFYHMKTYIKGEVPCLIEEVSLDDMIVFRL